MMSDGGVVPSMMSDASVTLSPRQQQRLQVLTRLVAGQCTTSEAAQLLGVSERQLWRLKAAFQQQGAVALVHGNAGRTTPWRLTDEVRDRVRALVATQYADCNDSHIAELLARDHDLFLSRASVRRILREGGSPAPHPRRPAQHRRRRDRFAQAGMLLQIDGSPHAWFGPDQPRCTLLGAIDDATSAVVAAVFRAQEDAQGYLLLLRQVLRTRGIPEALYHDRHGIFLRDPKTPWTRTEELAGVPDPTQFGRALRELGITSIAARSPQAKGRIERLWGTLQGRLVPELRLAGITSLDTLPSEFLSEYLARHNAQFAVAPNDPDSAYRPVTTATDLDRVLSFRYARVVNHDNTVQFDRQILQIPPGLQRRGYARAHVYVHEFLDGGLGIDFAGTWLVRTVPPANPPTLRAHRARRTHADTTTAPTDSSAPIPTAPTGPKELRPDPRKPAANHPWRR
jgi:transposase